jgi:uncharacterized protein
MGWNSAVEFDWDAANIKHLARHRIRREEVEEVFANGPAIVDYEFFDPEDRWSAVGATNSLRVLVIIFTVRGERIRPITGWLADRRTREEYFRRRGL